MRRALVCSAQAVMSSQGFMCYCAKAVMVLLWLEFFLTFFSLLLLVLSVAVYCLFETLVLSILLKSVVLSFLVESVALSQLSYAD